LEDQVRFISDDKPIAARKFKEDLIKSLMKYLKKPYHFKKSIYFNEEDIRDCVFKGFTCVYLVDNEQKIVSVFGLIKHKNAL